MAGFNLRGFDMNLLTVFEAVFETGSVSRAAERLALSQAAASHALARLRAVCADPLFIRAGPQFLPTPAARQLFPKVKDALQILRKGLAETLDFDPAISERHFNIVIPHPLGPVIAQTLRVAISNLAPAVSLRFDTKTMPPDLSAEMRAGEIDLAIDWLRIEQAEFVNARLIDEPLLLVVRRGHPRIRASPTLSDIRREDFVWLHPRRPREQRPKAAREVEDLGLRIVLGVSEWLEVPTLVAMFDLLSIVPRSIVPIVTERLQLDAHPFPAKLSPVPIFAVWHESRRRDAAHRWLRALVAAELRRETEA
jgi:DNA-binding transcriptional LysR family regulator